MTGDKMDEIEKEANDIYYKYFSNGPEVEFTCKSKEPGGVRRKGDILGQRVNNLEKRLRDQSLSNDSRKEILSAIEIYRGIARCRNLMD